MGATPGMVNMISTDGQYGQVPSAAVPQALADGHKLGIHVYLKDGTAGFVPHDKLGEALADGATYSQPQAQTDQPHGFMQSLASTIPQMAKSLYHNVADAPRDANEQAIKGTNAGSGSIANALGQFGLGGYRTLVAPSIANAKAAISDAQSPNLSNRLASASEAIGAIPVLGSGVDAGKSVIQQYLSGDKAGALGSTIGNLGTAGLTAAAGGELAAKPTAGALSPMERASIGVTKAINPPVTAFSSLDDSIRAQAPNVLDYAKRNGIAITDARDFGKAAQMAADETRSHYQNNFLSPNADKPVSILGSGYQGDTIGEGRGRATLGDVDARINAINRDLRSNYRKSTTGQVASAGASDAELEAEHANLTSILHKSLGDLTGVAPEDIQALRVRGGQLSTIASESRGASNAISAGAGKAEIGAGSGLPANAHGAIQEIISRLPGMSHEAVASRAVRGALRNMRDLPEATPTPLPQGIARFLNAQNIQQ